LKLQQWKIEAMKTMRTIVTFVRCASAGSISQGAREIGISPQAASKQILDLEAAVGTRLLRRGTRKVTLTEEGAIFYARCREALDSIDAGVRRLRQSADPAAGPVRLAVAPGSMAATLVAPLLGPLQQRHPLIHLDVIAQNEAPDFAGQAIDVGLVLGAGDMPEARRIATLPRILCAAPGYLRRQGRPYSIDQLRDHRWVVIRDGFDESRSQTLRLRGPKDVVTLQVPVSLVVNDVATALRAVLDGVGIGYFHPFRVVSDLRAGLLEVLDLGDVDEDEGLYVYVSQQTEAPTRSRLVADYLYEHLSRHPDFRPGACGRMSCACKAQPARLGEPRHATIPVSAIGRVQPRARRSAG
jgi:DNA-binding transcriptional LysR family regulator